ncbi:D-alanyl-D-alanine carboxypeptidase [Fulvivirga imtechensis AK7]|uniref:D-alanyl-D-alanine carboxypeptidase n=1 Tax=Fulvivirga imtechensis AK7 TaxID=1237149 RepID=L8JS58_9BACT|nr:D-alanyl-D-alanine carboxypeptidase [Fulvivirga imtechensis]ELR71053.1 D-alanyl-D-alanine carboxypeptidase [Fulvivirga imtechensis AK7]
MKFNHCLVFATIIFIACAPVKRGPVVKSIEAFEKEFSHHTGFVLFDPDNNEMLINYNGEKYFTPASNTKVLTLLTAIKTIGDSIPGIYYTEAVDSLMFWGTGDPSLLYEKLPSSAVFSFLNDTEKDLYFSSSNFYDDHFGPGWAWDDYNYTFSSEISPMPVFGNYLTVSKMAERDYLHLEQPYFKQFFWLGDSIKDDTEIVRDINSNNIIYFPSIKGRSFKEQVPFHYSDYLLTDLLSDTLNKRVTPVRKALPSDRKILRSIPADSAYRIMMQDSDNFIAEQLLLVAAGLLTDSLDAERAIEYSIEHYLMGIPDKPVWVDGSGLSRYNLITPRSMVWIWNELYKAVPPERLKSLLAVGGQAGTLKNYYRSTAPYIFGKTGTLSNNHNISGFILTKKGKLYIFAFMNNNYPVKAITVKRRMEQILWELHTNN